MLHLGTFYFVFSLSWLPICVFIGFVFVCVSLCVYVFLVLIIFSSVVFLLCFILVCLFVYWLLCFLKREKVEVGLDGYGCGEQGGEEEGKK